MAGSTSMITKYDVFLCERFFFQESIQNDAKGSWWSQSWFPSIYSSFSTKIVENLQLEIKDVHIRYSAKERFSFCVKINSLTVQFTNQKWVCFIYNL